MQHTLGKQEDAFHAPYYWLIHDIGGGLRMSMTFSQIAAMVLSFLLCSEVLGSDDVADVVRDTKSEPVSLGSGDFRLVARGGRRLVLEHSTHERAIEWEVDPEELKSDDASRQDSWLSEGQNARITEIALSRWSRTSLVAVVKVSRGSAAAFWCLTFEHTERYNGESTVAPGAALLLKGDAKYQILALSGSRNPPAITALIGKRSKVAHPTNACLAWCKL